jgi:predicted esterase
VSDLDFVHHYQPGQTADAPTLMLLHGTGGNEQDLLPVAPDLLPGAGVLSPRGKVLEHGMPRFFRRLAEGVFDLDDLRARTAELADFVAAAAAHYGFDPTRVVAVGFSNGANIAGSLLLLRPGVVQRAVLFRAMVPLVPDPLPSLPHTPVLISNGRADPIVPLAETERLAALLRAAGADVTLAWQNAGHHLIREDLDRARAWLQSSDRQTTGTVRDTT